MPLMPADFDYLRKLVRDRSGIVLGDDKAYLIESRLGPVAKIAGVADIAQIVVAVKAQPTGALSRMVVEAMTTNETFFFRDIAPFQALQKVVLEHLVAARAATRKIEMWCAASSTGQEPYTIAMVMREHFPQLASWQTRFIATDLSTEVLKKAQSGRYSQLEVNRGLPAPLLVKWFTRSGLDWQIKDELRKLIEFRELNLLESWPFAGQFDIIFIRNVLIYFDVPTKKDILGRCRRLLRPDGFLFLGGAETTMNLDDAFERVPADKAGLYRLKPGAGGGTP